MPVFSITLVLLSNASLLFLFLLRLLPLAVTTTVHYKYHYNKYYYSYNYCYHHIVCLCVKHFIWTISNVHTILEDRSYYTHLTNGTIKLINFVEVTHSVILWFTIRNIYLVFIPIPDTELLKSLEFPVMRAIKMTFVMWKWWLLESTWGWGRLPVELTMWLEIWKFQSTSHLPTHVLSLGRREGLEIEFNHQCTMI